MTERFSWMARVSFIIPRPQFWAELYQTGSDCNQTIPSEKVLEF